MRNHQISLENPHKDDYAHVLNTQGVIMAESKVYRRNVLGTELMMCCQSPLTGFYRDGYCRTDQYDQGRHIVCAEMTDEFLQFSLSQGNDLITARPQFDFPGLKAGDRWCLCVLRWKEAWENNVAPPVILASCDYSALEVVPLEILKHYATL